MVQLGIPVLMEFLTGAVTTGLPAALDGADTAIDAAARRLVDYKLGSIARRLRLLKQDLTGDNLDAGQVMAEIGRLYLLASALRQKTGAAELDRYILTLAGRPIRRQQVLSNGATRQNVVCLGCRISRQEQLRVRQCWFWLQKDAGYGMTLDFAPRSATLPPTLPAGVPHRADVYYYPGPAPRRILLENTTPDSGFLVPRVEDITGALQLFRQLLGHNPWLLDFPVTIRGNLGLTSEGPVLSDASQNCLPIHKAHFPEALWRVIDDKLVDGVFGTWDGYTFVPVSWVIGNTVVENGGVEVS